MVEFIEKLGHQFLLILFHNENLYYLMCSCTNPIFGKIFVPKIWVEMFSAIQIVGFFNQPYIQNKSMKQSDFLQVDTNSCKLKIDQKFFLSGHAKKWIRLFWSQDSKIGCISRVNRWNEIIFWGKWAKNRLFEFKEQFVC